MGYLRIRSPGMTACGDRVRLSLRRAGREALVRAEPGDHVPAGAAGPGYLRASDADREQVIGVLKAAFVQGRLTRDELGVRAGRVLASRTYAELAAITASIPAGLTEAPTPAPARVRKPVSKKIVAWSACAIMSPAALWAAFLTFYGGFLVMFLLTFAGLIVTAAPWPPERGSRTAPAGAGTRRRS
jgi:hypothetical protein